MTKSLHCFEPQDQIFGMMGLLREMDPKILSSQDSASIPDLYTEFSKYVLLRSTRKHYWWNYLNMSFTLEKRETLPSCPR